MNTYMALHARVEPDMQFHIFCPEKKVIRLAEIFDSMEKYFPAPPPADKLFVAINRPLLEEEGRDDRNNINNRTTRNPIAVENLQVLNNAIQNGLWGGSVQVFDDEIGNLTVRNHAHLSAYPGISGAIVDYFSALEAVVFVGTRPVSSFSTDLIAARFYRGETSTMLKNYHYLPTGLEVATPGNATYPPRFNG